VSQPWGIDLTSDSANSLTVTKVEEGGLMESLGWLQKGDVILSLDGDSTKVGMVNKMKSGTSLAARVVRYTTFDAALERPAGEPLMVELRNEDGYLQIDSITSEPTGTSAIVRYNEAYFARPLVDGDYIMAVNGKTGSEEMTKELAAGTRLVLSVQRSG
jgi:hypothetical protein